MSSRGGTLLRVRDYRFAIVLSFVACASRPPPQAPVTAHGLRTADSFQSISDANARSAALFLEASRVFTHPRCINCHPNGDTPGQGTPDRPHDPPVTRGADDRGVVGMRCTSCHQDHNLELSRVPGAPEWHLAPRQMAWVGRSPSQICEQMKDPKRNGGRTLEQIVDHSAHDKLVAWGWSPGHDREPAPGTQEQLGALVAAWVQSGAACPKEGERP
jgi:hypothetical protein